MSDTIDLRDIWQIENVEDYKVHFARRNKEETEPLDDWVSNSQNWQSWQESRPKKNAFNREFIFSLMRFYHEPDIWLFGGIFRVLKVHENRYEVKLTPQLENFIGRLKLRSSYRNRPARVNFENHVGNLIVQEILRERYSGE